MSDQSTALTERRVDRGVADAINAKGGINFENAGQVMEFAKLMAGSGSAVPRHLRGQPGACLGVLDDAIRFGFNPYGLARKSYFVNDQLAYEAAVFMAIVNARAPLKDRPDIVFEGEGPNRVCIVTGVFTTGAIRTYRSPRFDDIHPKNSTQWKNDPDQQQSYFSLRAWARRWCPEVILGVFDVDELRVEAMHDVTPVQQAAPRTLQEFGDSDVGMIDSQPGEGVEQVSAVVSEPVSAAPASPAAPRPEADRQPSAAGRYISDAMRLASDPTASIDKRLDRIEVASEDWFRNLPNSFCMTLLSYAQKVAKGELKPDEARKYLTALAPEGEA